MTNTMKRRDALRVGVNAAISAAVAPLLGAQIQPDVTTTLTDGVSMRANAGSDSSDEICYMRAVDLMDGIRTKKISAREAMQAHLKQIARVNSRVNAMVTMVPEDKLMAQAAAADESLAKGKWLGPLHG